MRHALGEAHADSDPRPRLPGAGGRDRCRPSRSTGPPEWARRASACRMRTAARRAAVTASGGKAEMTMASGVAESSAQPFSAVRAFEACLQQQGREQLGADLSPPRPRPARRPPMAPKDASIGSPGGARGTSFTAMNLSAHSSMCSNTSCASASGSEPRSKSSSASCRAGTITVSHTSCAGLRAHGLFEQLVRFVAIAREQPLIETLVRCEHRLIAQQRVEEGELRDVFAHHHQTHRHRDREQQSDRPPHPRPERRGDQQRDRRNAGATADEPRLQRHVADRLEPDEQPRHQHGLRPVIEDRERQRDGQRRGHPDADVGDEPQRHRERAPQHRVRHADEVQAERRCQCPARS